MSENCSSIGEILRARSGDPIFFTTSIGLGIVDATVIFGNTLVILAVLISQSLRSVTSLLITSLAVADLLLGLLVLPFSITTEILSQNWIFGRIWCHIWLLIDVWMCTASIYNLVAISVERYVAIIMPLRYATIMTMSRARMAVTGAWTISFLISCPPMVLNWPDAFNSMGSNDNDNNNGSLSMGCGCSPMNNSPGYIVYSSSGSFFIPMFIITWVYCQIYRVVRRIAREDALSMAEIRETTPMISTSTHKNGGGGQQPALNVLTRATAAEPRPSTTSTTTRLLSASQQHISPSTHPHQYHTLRFSHQHQFNDDKNNRLSLAAIVSPSRKQKLNMRTSRSLSGSIENNFDTSKHDDNIDENPFDNNITVTSSCAKTVELRITEASVVGAVEEQEEEAGALSSAHPSPRSKTINEKLLTKSPTNSSPPTTRKMTSRNQQISSSSTDHAHHAIPVFGRRHKNTNNSFEEDDLGQPRQQQSLGKDNLLQQQQRIKSFTTTNDNKNSNGNINIAQASLLHRGSSSTTPFHSHRNSSNASLSFRERVMLKASSRYNKQSRPSSQSGGQSNQFSQQSHQSHHNHNHNHNHHQNNRMSTELKAVKMVAIITGCFIFCWLGFSIIYLLRALPFCQNNPHCIPSTTFSLFFWLGYTNSALNPLLYALLNRQFRRAFRKLLTCSFY